MDGRAAMVGASLLMSDTFLELAAMAAAPDWTA